MLLVLLLLVGDGGEVLSVSADPAGEKDALELRIDLNGGVGGGDALWFELSGLSGELGLLAGEGGAAEVRVERVGVQVDGDVEVGVMGVKVPGGYGSEWLGMLPVVLEEGELSFGERLDGSADWSDPQALLRGVVRLGGLREGLRKGLEQEGLDVEWWSKYYRDSTEITPSVFIKVGEEYQGASGGALTIYNGYGATGAPAYPIYSLEQTGYPVIALPAALPWEDGVESMAATGGYGYFSDYMMGGTGAGLTGSGLFLKRGGNSVDIRSTDQHTLSFLNWNWQFSPGTH